MGSDIKAALVLLAISACTRGQSPYPSLPVGPPNIDATAGRQSPAAQVDDFARPTRLASSAARACAFHSSTHVFSDFLHLRTALADPGYATAQSIDKPVPEFTVVVPLDVTTHGIDVRIGGPRIVVEGVITPDEAPLYSRDPILIEEMIQLTSGAWLGGVSDAHEGRIVFDAPEFPFFHAFSPMHYEVACDRIQVGLPASADDGAVPPSPTDGTQMSVVGPDVPIARSATARPIGALDATRPLAVRVLQNDGAHAQIVFESVNLDATLTGWVPSDRLRPAVNRMVAGSPPSTTMQPLPVEGSAHCNQALPIFVRMHGTLREIGELPASLPFEVSANREGMYGIWLSEVEWLNWNEDAEQLVRVSDVEQHCVLGDADY